MTAIGMDFFDALRQVYQGRRLTRLEWGNPDTYILLRDGFLCIHQDNKFSRLLVSDGDMGGDDWIIATDGPIN